MRIVRIVQVLCGLAALGVVLSAADDRLRDVVLFAMGMAGLVCPLGRSNGAGWWPHWRTAVRMAVFLTYSSAGMVLMETSSGWAALLLKSRWFAVLLSVMWFLVVADFVMQPPPKDAV